MGHASNHFPRSQASNSAVHDVSALSPLRFSAWVRVLGGWGLLLRPRSWLSLREHTLSIQRCQKQAVWVVVLYPCFKPSSYLTFWMWPWPPPCFPSCLCCPPTNPSPHPQHGMNSLPIKLSLCLFPRVPITACSLVSPHLLEYELLGDRPGVTWILSVGPGS